LCRLDGAFTQCSMFRPEGIPDNASYEDIGGGLFGWVTGNRVVHWNINVPVGDSWAELCPVDSVCWHLSRYSRCPGIYRLIGLDYHKKPVVLTRVLGNDETGTLYIGWARNLGAGRVSKLVRSLQPALTRDGVIIGFNNEHPAGERSRTNLRFSRRFRNTGLR
jgi:hypothetical protein